MYSRNTFRFVAAADAIAAFQMFPPEGMRFITSLELRLYQIVLLDQQRWFIGKKIGSVVSKPEHWVQLWDILAQLPRLRHVRVHLMRNTLLYSREKWDRDLSFGPLMNFSKKLDRFDVQIDWFPLDMEQFKDAPFCLILPQR